MPEPFKNFFNVKMIRLMGDHLHRADNEFDYSRFVKLASRNLKALELKERSNQISSALEATLPENYRQACQQMLAACQPVKQTSFGELQMDNSGICGWAIMPMADFVASRGLEDFDFSMGILKKLTPLFTAEFAVRPFIIHNPERALKIASKWAQDNNTHVRRLASEGTRPRLPWGIQLSEFVQEPSPVLPILEQLKNDPEEYVRRSVANNLNDIAKDHPDVVAAIAARWMKGADVNRQRLVRHACRTLIKQGHKPTLKALGYKTPKVTLQALVIESPRVKLGGHLEFNLHITSNSRQSQALIVDYVIHHRKNNGATTPKVFKWKNLDLAAGSDIEMAKKHAIRPVTTRVYYAGKHHLEIQVNGVSVGTAEFELSL